MNNLQVKIIARAKVRMNEFKLKERLFIDEMWERDNAKELDKEENHKLNEIWRKL